MFRPDPWPCARAQCPVCYQWFQHFSGESCNDAKTRYLIRSEMLALGLVKEPIA